MIGFYLLAAHMTGDYILQSTHMAANKLTDGLVRGQHVTVYTACFAPIAFAFADVRQALAFLAALWISHYATDSKRWRTSNPWPAMPILQDQSLHAVQLALLGALLLR